MGRCLAWRPQSIERSLGAMGAFGLGGDPTDTRICRPDQGVWFIAQEEDLTPSPPLSESLRLA